MKTSNHVGYDTLVDVDDVSNQDLLFHMSSSMNSIHSNYFTAFFSELISGENTQMAFSNTELSTNAETKRNASK